MPRYNEVYFDFGLTPVEAESLYRMMNYVLNEDLDESTREVVEKFRDRVLEFTKKHPCRYGVEALD